MNVLIIDDDDIFRHLVADTLKQEHSIECHEADSGEAGLAILKDRSFDLILLDYKMPGLTGLNVLQTLHEQKNETPVVMLTAAGSEFIAVEGMKLGAYDYIRKEQLDIDHLPIIIRGVQERFLFRQERKRREQFEHEREKHIMALKASHEAVNSFAHIINTALTLISLDAEYITNDLLPQLDPEKQKKLHDALLALNHQYNTVAATTKSMLAISSRLYDSFSAASAQAAAASEAKSRETSALGIEPVAEPARRTSI